jgi:multidrug efflux pump subunit AcrB
MLRSIDWFARNPAVANLLMILLLGAGLMSIPNTRQETLPNVPLDRIGVTVLWPQATPDAVEKAICGPVENAIHGVEGTTALISEAREGNCTLQVDVVEGHDTRQVLESIRARMESLDTLPATATRPRVKELMVRNRVARLVLSGELSEADLHRLAWRLREELLTLDDISSVDVDNLPGREMTVAVSRADLYRFDLTFNDIAAAASRGVETVAGGLLRSDRGEFMLQAGSRPETVPDFEALAIRQGERGDLLHMGDVARIRDGFSRDEMGAWYDGRPAAALDIFRVGNQNVMDVAGAVKRYVSQKELPAGVSLVVWRDDARQFQERSGLLWRNAAQGLGLLALMLAVFLSLRLAGWVALGIPVAMLGACVVLPLTGESFNTISLFAFILVLGIVVDDAVIVGESVDLARRRGLQGAQAAISGAREVARPIFFAVLTTVLAFSPLLFLPGPEGSLMQVIPVVAIAILVLSLLESLWILPAHLSARPSSSTLLDRSEHFSNRVNQALDNWLDRRFRPLLRSLLRWRYVLIAGFAALVVLCLALVHSGWLTMVLFSRVEGDRVMAEVTFPQGVPAERIRDEVRALQLSGSSLADALGQEQGEPVIEHIYAEQGVRQKISNADDPVARHRARVSLAVASKEGDTAIPAREIARRWREQHGKVPDALSTRFHASLLRVQPDININLYHPDLEVLGELSRSLALRLQSLQGVHEVSNSLDARRTVIDIRLLPTGRHAGLDAENLGRQVRQAFHGVELDQIYRDGREVPVMLRLSSADSRTLEDLARLPVALPSGERTLLAAVATLTSRDTPAMISHYDRRRNASLTGFVNEHLTSPRHVMNTLEQGFFREMHQRYPEASWGIAGKPLAINTFLGYLNTSYLLALAAIFFVLTVLFGSWGQPVLVMIAIPFGLVGSFLGHFLLGYELTLWSLVGVIAVSGVVVNDNLVLLDRINTLRSAGAGLHAAVEDAAVRRFRPIMLTTLTTFAGVTPLMLESSAQARFLIPMAVSLAFGVLFATLISLMLVPALLLVSDDMRRRWRHRYALAPGEADTVEQAYQLGRQAALGGGANPYRNDVLASAWEAGRDDELNGAPA